MMESIRALDQVGIKALEDVEERSWATVSLPRKNTFIVMPAYNAEKKILSVFERIPTEVWDRSVSFVIVNDGSTDGTRAKIDEIRSRWGERITIIDKPQNEGYARAQKDAFTAALNGGADIVILLHSDSQYAPEMLPELLKPLEEEKADIVQGSRMVNKRDALKGGMPFYKFLANVALSTVENLVYGLNFAEYHSGYMLYSRKALETIPFLKLSDTFHFDGEMLFVGAKKGLRVKELPIPTQYADEESHLKPIQYGLNVLGIMMKYLVGKYNF
jgi:Predicted glycosyltransferases